MDALLLPIVKVNDYYFIVLVVVVLVDYYSKTYVIFNLPKLNITDQRLKNLAESIVY